MHEIALILNLKTQSVNKQIHPQYCESFLLCICRCLCNRCFQWV